MPSCRKSTPEALEALGDDLHVVEDRDVDHVLAGLDLEEGQHRVPLPVEKVTVKGSLFVVRRGRWK
jgi:hypothetical protein